MHPTERPSRRSASSSRSRTLPFTRCFAKLGATLSNPSRCNHRVTCSSVHSFTSDGNSFSLTIVAREVPEFDSELSEG